MFNFRIIIAENGEQVIDTNLKTPYEALTGLQLTEYIKVEETLRFLEREKRKRERLGRKILENLMLRLSCIFG